MAKIWGSIIAPPPPFPLVPPVLWYKEERRKALQGENCISFATLDVSLDVTNLHIWHRSDANSKKDLIFTIQGLS